MGITTISTSQNTLVEEKISKFNFEIGTHIMRTPDSGPSLGQDINFHYSPISFLTIGVGLRGQSFISADAKHLHIYTRLGFQWPNPRKGPFIHIDLGKHINADEQRAWNSNYYPSLSVGYRIAKPNNHYWAIALTGQHYGYEYLYYSYNQYETYSFSGIGLRVAYGL